MDGDKDGNNLALNVEFIQLIILILLVFGALINKLTKGLIYFIKYNYYYFEFQQRSLRVR